MVQVVEHLHLHLPLPRKHWALSSTPSTGWGREGTKKCDVKFVGAES
jgi:diadenosine tetraphosphate (Ap4A) HIT family hydrolase